MSERPQPCDTSRIDGRRLASLAPALALAVLLSGCSPSNQTPSERPKLGKFAEQIVPPAASLKEQTKRAIKPLPPPSAAQAPPMGYTVEEASSIGCTTTIVGGLSKQIIGQSNCLSVGAYDRVPALPNLTFGEAVFPYMSRPAKKALVKMLSRYDQSRMKVNSMLRTVAQQYLLYRWYKRGRCGISLAARPGKSNHQTGLALDIANPKRWRKRFKRYGFRWMGKKDRWHFDYVGRKAKKRRKLDVKAFQQLWNLNNPDDIISDDGGFGEDTEERLKTAPAKGFPKGPSCDPASD